MGKKKYDLKFVRYSGLELSGDRTPAAAYKMGDLVSQVMSLYGGVLRAAASEPWYLDDVGRQMEERDLIHSYLGDGEFFACFANDEFIGFVALSKIIPGREAYIDAYSLPQFRKKIVIRRIMDKVVTYCWERLRLVKLKCGIAEQNVSSIRACARVGFRYIGISPMDGLYLGHPANMILLELFNPAYLSPPPEVIHEQEESKADDADSADIHANPDSGAVQPDDPASNDGAANPVVGNKGGKRSKSNRPVALNPRKHKSDAKPRSKAKVSG
jgi:RimJ/RimL family protein N-acetyltransferase